MQTLYGIHVNHNNQVSVDVFSERRSGPSKWRVYFGVRPLTVARLRRIYAAFPKRFIITREWSPARWKAYKVWALGPWSREARPDPEASLDSLETSGRHHANP